MLACPSPRERPEPSAPKPTASPEPPKVATEPHLTELKQLTFGGENAEAYWSSAGDQLILQARTQGMGCDQIYRLKIGESKPTQISSGKGATTCSYFLPGDQDVIYASTHLGGDACPPKPDHSKGYVWALYDSYDIFRSKVDGTGLTRLTETPGYDAEGTVCRKDGSILFTSVRDGDLELYRMDADGKNVKRLTHTVGYDGGAFFSDDCSKIVWRASRPTGKALEDYTLLLKQGLVRPSKLELFVANADGTNAQQVTYLDAASFGPYLYPDGKRIIFSSNVGDPKGREFELWAINTDGSELERITQSPGFDGFPMFSPDGKSFVFASNRATAPGAQDTNLFLAKWAQTPINSLPTGADRTKKDALWLSDPAREGRGVGSKGLEQAGAYLEKRFQEIGLEPGLGKSFRQPFEVAVSVTGEAALEVAGQKLEGTKTLSMASSGSAEGQLVLAGYGIQGEGRDDYKGLDVKGKIVVVRRFVPDEPAFEKQDPRVRHGDLRRKAWLAREKGAKALIVVDQPEKPKAAKAGWKEPEEAKAPAMVAEGTEAGIPVALASRAAFAATLQKLGRKENVEAKLTVSVASEKKPVFNVVGRLSAPAQDKLPGVIVVGAHYDHLGMGGHGSLAPGETAVHHGADDNASGVAAMLEVAFQLKSKGALRRDVVFIAFSGEERGVLGSNFFTKNAPPGLAPGDIYAMLNLDMVGRVRENRIDLLGHDTATELEEVARAACADARLACNFVGGGGYGPSDQAPFYAAGVPVISLFSGTHADYHKPSDTADKLNAAGMWKAAEIVEGVAKRLAARPTKLSYQAVPSPRPRGDSRSFGASLGTVPDYAGDPKQKGVLLAGARPGGAAEKAGMKRGDVLVEIGPHAIGSVEDLMFVLGEVKPGQKMKATVVRDGKRVTMDVTFQESKRH